MSEVSGCGRWWEEVVEGARRGVCAAARAVADMGRAGEDWQGRARGLSTGGARIADLRAGMGQESQQNQHRWQQMRFKQALQLTGVGEVRGWREERLDALGVITGAVDFACR